MLSVFKYEIEPSDYIKIEMPIGAKILDVQTQFEKPCIWALVDPDASPEIRCFRWAGTGHKIEESENQLKFIGTFQMQGGFLVFHLFEILL